MTFCYDVMTKSYIDWRPSWILPIWRPLWAPALAPSKKCIQYVLNYICTKFHACRQIWTILPLFLPKPLDYCFFTPKRKTKLNVLSGTSVGVWELSTARALETYGWMSWNVSATNHPLEVVHTSAGAIITVHTMKTYRFPALESAQNWHVSRLFSRQFMS